MSSERLKISAEPLREEIPLQQGWLGCGVVVSQLYRWYIPLLARRQHLRETLATRDGNQVNQLFHSEHLPCEGIAYFLSDASSRHGIL